MPVKLPKYAHWVAERRFLVDAANLPKLDEAAARRIEDLYIDGGRLSLAPSPTWRPVSGSSSWPRSTRPTIR